MSYDDWNEAICRHFFNEQMSGREVLIFVNKEIIDEIGQGIGSDYNGFLRSIIDPDSNDPEGICRRAVKLMRDWRRDGGSDLPPYVAYLALFVLAGTLEGDFSPNSYYPRLRELLGLPKKSGPFRGFNRTVDLWDDLEFWSKEEKKGGLGIFSKRIRGKHAYVGIPLSQLVISDKERKHLASIFSYARIRENDNLTNAFLKSVLISFGERFLEKKTKKILERDDQLGISASLLEFCRDELKTLRGLWGTFGCKVALRRRSKHMVRLSLMIDRFSQKAVCYAILAARINPSESKLLLEHRGNLLSCKLREDGTYGPIVNEPACSNPIDASTLDWGCGELFLLLNEGSFAVLEGKSVRFFVKDPGSQHFIETGGFPICKDFVAICNSEFESDLEEWGSINCNEFRRLRLFGLPDGWVAFSVKAPKSALPGIAYELPENIKFKITGLYRLPSGSYIAGPAIKAYLEGGNEAFSLFGNGNRIDPYSLNPPSWSIDQTILNGAGELNIALHYMGIGEPIRQKRFPIAKLSLSDLKLEEHGRNAFGELMDCLGEACAWGAEIKNDRIDCHALDFQWGDFSVLPPAEILNRLSKESGRSRAKRQTCFICKKEFELPSEPGRSFFCKECLDYIRKKEWRS